MRILFLCNQWHITGTPVRTVGTHPELTGGPHQWVRALVGPRPNWSLYRRTIVFEISRQTLVARSRSVWPDAES